MGSIELNGGYREEDFKVDGSLRDVCVLGADLTVWGRFIRAAANSPWDRQFEVNGEPWALEDFSVRALFAAREEGGDVSARLGIRVEEMWFDCFIFDVKEIEFSFDPSELTQGWYFKSLEQLMIWLAETCDRRVVLTMETTNHNDIPPLLEVITKST